MKENKTGPKKTAYSENQAVNYDVERFTTPGGKLIHKLELKQLDNELQKLSLNPKVLEVGCGTGRFLEELMFRDLILEGIDASPHMLRMAEQKIKRTKKDIKLKTGQANSLPYPDNSFDFVYSIRVLNQTEGKTYALAVIEEMLRVVKPEKCILVEFANKYRPRIGRNKKKAVRLTCNEVKKAAMNQNGLVVNTKGLFFFGMGSYLNTPSAILNCLIAIDKIFALLLPNLCARTYLTIKKMLK